MTDQELLELAAKANGDTKIVKSGNEYCRIVGYSDEMQCDILCSWNPLLDDGDALRLAVRLKIAVYNSRAGITAEYQGIYCDESQYPDPYVATRRAIVRSAAVIGKTS